MNTYIVILGVVVVVILVAVILTKYKEKLTFDEEYISNMLYNLETRGPVTTTPGVNKIKNPVTSPPVAVGVGAGDTVGVGADVGAGDQEFTDTVDFNNDEINPAELLPSMNELNEFDDVAATLYADETNYLSHVEDFDNGSSLSSRRNMSQDLRGGLHIPQIDLPWGNSDREELYKDVEPVLCT